MSLLTLIDPRTRIGPIVIDYSEQEEHGIDIEITSQVIEGVVQVTDHAIVRPQVLRIEGRVLTFSRWRPVIIPGFAKRSYLKLEAAARLRLPMIVQTRLKTYPSMLIGSVKARTTPNDYQSLMLSIEMRQIVTTFGGSAEAAAFASDMADPGVDLGTLGGTAAA